MARTLQQSGKPKPKKLPKHERDALRAAAQRAHELGRKYIIPALFAIPVALFAVFFALYGWGSTAPAAPLIRMETSTGADAGRVQQAPPAVVPPSAAAAGPDDALRGESPASRMTSEQTEQLARMMMEQLAKFAGAGNPDLKLTFNDKEVRVGDLVGEGEGVPFDDDAASSAGDAAPVGADAQAGGAEPAAAAAQVVDADDDVDLE
ncbi:hypothetical protein AMAG_02902 [Allomyces macrogynus ATCC 38327]|uniref:Transmembrane protein n=1 Tax=Allomyces macrogynus (strain ATCC 38327) TaxID=578462 RepID=A0A0L0S413_ALLM3|nr:hypothetical protein AMAG_02902 [Allomyces macrogynus ATCC 38327]|eukprot:KNE57155.1 hypothetical protein AMAG_02902 [Allomyces macrogynus ATCC 38327]